MKKITKYGKRMKLLFACTAFVASACVMSGISWTKSLAKAEEQYYSVFVDGKIIGQVSDTKKAEDAYIEARKELGKQSEEIVYVDTQLEFVENNALIGRDTEEEVLVENICQELKKQAIDVNQKAYVLTVEDTSVTLASLEEVTQVMNHMGDTYDTEDVYQTVIVEDKTDRFATATCTLVKATIEPENRPIVKSSAEIFSEQAVVEAFGEISFGNEIAVVETVVPDEQILSVEQAIEVLQPVVAVVTTKTETYVEAVPYDTEYVYNENKYSDYTNVLQEGVDGQALVTADITYKNGIEESRVVLKSDVQQEAISMIVEVGTKEKPELIIPLSRPRITSFYGSRWGTTHYGLDFGCSTGTSIFASESGTVTEAGWSDSFGYNIIVNHGDGLKTRYAHLSKLLVSTGDKVEQGDIIGKSGNTGNSTGPHLHFEVIQNGNRVDPYPFLYEN